MEKIKQALKRAREERDKGQGVTPAAKAADSSPVNGSITYTRTRSLDGSAEAMRENRLISSMQSEEYTESIKILATQVLKRMRQNEWGSIAVTSPRSSSGKTTVAINLGLAIAKEVDFTVLIVDANLRRPVLHEHFGLVAGKGLSDYLSGDIELSDALINPRGIEHFVMLPAGTPVQNSSEMLGSPKMEALVAELKSRYPRRIIVFDLPSVLDQADMLNFAPCVDSALLVIEEDATSEKDLKAAMGLLKSTNVVGTVLNKSTH